METIRLSEADRKRWGEMRSTVINILIQKMNYKPSQVWQRAVIFKGVSRLVDEKFNTADRKLSAVDGGVDYVVETIEKTGYSTNQKNELINEILTNTDLFTEEMLAKLSTKELQSLKEKVIG